MQFTTGTVDYLKVGDDFGFVQIHDEVADRPELLILWFGDGNAGSPNALFIMQLSIALARRLRVELMHDDHSAYVLRVRLFGA